MLDDYINARINEAYYLMQNDTKRALEIFDEVLEIEPENIEGLNGKGSSLMKLNQFDEAEKYFNKSLSICKNSSALLNKGIINKLQKNYYEALLYYDKALEINPNLKNIITILKNEIDDMNKIDLKNKAEQLIVRGIELKEKNKLLSSLKMFRNAVEVDASCKDKANKHIDEIMLLYEKEFIYEDSEFNINNKLDRLKMQSLKALIKENNPKKAVTLMDLILKFNENNPDILNHKGGVLFICKKYQEAIDCFDKCLSINNNYYCALYNKAIVLMVMDKLPEALKCFNELLKVPGYYEKVKHYQIEITDKLYK